MRRWGPVLAIVWVLIAAAITLAMVARNRAGEPDSDIVLTERELSLPGEIEEESTGLALHIDWRGPRASSSPGDGWLDRAKLESLGFDCRYPAEAPSARDHYLRMQPRKVVLVFEYEGDSWKRWMEARKRETEEALRKATDGAGAESALDRERTSATRLTVVDAGLDPAALRRLYPDRSRYVLARGVVAPVIELDVGKKLGKPPVLRGQVRWLEVDSVHVPHGKTTLLEALAAGDRKARKTGAPAAAPTPEQPWMPEITGPPRYKVRVRWGQRLEPWIVAVEPL
jgi:hypothetical protein